MAARSDQPLNTPRIFQVQNPGTNTYAVMVLMATPFTSKYPDKPWGTAIDAIGLSKKDSDLYPGYTLVDFEPMKGSSDLFWIFQNLSTAPAWTTKSLGQESLIPQKYRRLVTTVRTKQEVDPATEPTAITGNLTSSVVEQQDNTGKAVRVNTTEVIAENAEALVGEEYGDIVTKSVSETLVNEGEAADTGIDVISSVVESLGNGKAVKQTKRAKSPGWPDPTDKEVSKEGADQPPARYRKDLTRTRTTRKIAASAIPNTPSLSGNEVGKSYKKETPDRAEEITTTQVLTLNTSSVDEAVEQKPFVKILSRMTPGGTSALPSTGNGSSRLVYDGPGGQKIYENTAEVATARPGPSGVEKDVKPYVTITTSKRYSTSNSIGTNTGSANVVFNDGSVLVYEVSEITSAGRSGPAGTARRGEAWGVVRSDMTYSESGNLSGPGSSKVIYNDGNTLVYEVSEDTAEIQPVSFISRKETNPLYISTSTSTYGGSATSSGDISESRVVYNDGRTTVYENEETSILTNGQRTYQTVVRFAVPAVLLGFTTLLFARKDGEVEAYYEPNIEEGFDGYFPATVIEKFEITPVGPSKPIKTFHPMPISGRTPFSNIKISPTLHGPMFITATVGSSHPTYESGTYRTDFPATNPVHWRGQGDILVAYQSDPFKNGFITREVYVTL